MGSYIVKRLISAVIVVWVVITVTFFLMRAIPGGPFASEKKIPPQILRNIEARYHLNDPLWKQYRDYLINFTKGDLGPSFKYPGQNVNDIIAKRFPVSAVLGLSAVFIALCIGVPAGVISALKQNKWQDFSAMFLATIGVSVPSFVLASLFMYLLAYKLDLFPTALWGTPKHVVLPALALAAFPMAFFARLMRSSMLEVLQQDFIRTAKAKGLSQRVVIYRHAIRNALIPLITYLGPEIAMVVTGSFVIENIFAIPGLGKYYVNSIYARDYTMVLGITVFYSALLVLMNILVDIAYAIIDPRIKLTEIKE